MIDTSVSTEYQSAYNLGMTSSRFIAMAGVGDDLQGGRGGRGGARMGGGEGGEGGEGDASLSYLQQSVQQQAWTRELQRRGAASRGGRP